MRHRRETRSHKHKVFVNHSGPEARKSFFSCRVVEHWNALPADIVDADSFTLFKAAITVHLHDVLFNPL